MAGIYTPIKADLKNHNTIDIIDLYLNHGSMIGKKVMFDAYINAFQGFNRKYMSVCVYKINSCEGGIDCDYRVQFYLPFDIKMETRAIILDSDPDDVSEFEGTIYGTVVSSYNQEIEECLTEYSAYDPKLIVDAINLPKM